MERSEFTMLNPNADLCTTRNHKKRLFLFAGYDVKKIIDDSTVIYVRELSKIGDVVFFMDNEVSQSELEKVLQYTLFATGLRHEEYDFGSYKRGYIWARDNNILNHYEWVYLINDSVYGPFFSLQPYLESLELPDIDAVTMNYNPHKFKDKKPHLQSWFIGISNRVAISEWFEVFITNIVKQNKKEDIIDLYERGFTQFLRLYNLRFKAYSVTRDVRNNIKSRFKKGFPFIKKSLFSGKKNILAGNCITYYTRFLLK